MAKKRKASSAAGGAAGGSRHEPQTLDQHSDKRFKMNVRSWEDVADSEDEWDLARDKIMVDEGPERKRARRAREEADALEDSEEEVLGVDSDMDEDDEEEGEAEGGDGDGDAEKEDEAEEEEGWGADEAYGADVAENEEDAREIEREAIRLQKKKLQGMTDADFGFDEAEWLDADKDENEAEDQGTNSAHVEKLPDFVDTTGMSEEEQYRILTARYPEFEPLRKEFLALELVAEEMGPSAKAAMMKFESSWKAASRNGIDSENVLPFAVAKYHALTGYLATIAMYFALLTSPAAEADSAKKIMPLDPKILREHSIMDALVRTRALWERLRHLNVEDDSEDETNDVENGQAGVNDDLSDEASFYTPKQSPLEKSKHTKAIASQADSAKVKTKSKSKTLTSAEKAALKVRAEKTARRDAQLRKLDEDMAALTKNITSKRTQSTKLESKSATIPDDDSDFGDETTLTAHEAAEKARRKKSLRFYTSQIAQKVNKRDAAMQNGGGDADLPYRERLKDRVARLNAEAEARGKKKGTQDHDLGSDSGNDSDSRLAKEIRSDANGDDDDDGQGEEEDYYQTIASATSAKKHAAALRREAQKEAALRGATVREVETVGADGKRAIGYTIEKNKGLTPHRKKAVRNPRVKKKEAFEKKKKKLGSVKQVWKGGEGRGGYGGELTGIKKGLVRAVKL